MPLSRKHQILAKIETSEGQNANPGAPDAVLVYEPTIQDDVQTSDRVPAGATLSRDFVPVGRKTRTVTFTSDFRGSGDVTIPVTVPEWGTLIGASAFRASSPVALPITSPTGLGYQLGEIVRKSTNVRGVVIGLFIGTALQARLAVAGTVVVLPIEGVFTSTGTLTGECSGTTGTLGTVAAYAGLGYQPTSEKSINCTTGAWSASAPAVGDVAVIKSGTTTVGHAQIIADNAAGAFTDVDLTLLWGSIANGNTLTVGANSATISATPTQKRTQSATMRSNLDGRRRDLVGARGDFEVQGEAGGPLVFNWTFTGDPATSSDAMPVATSGLSSIRPPRLFGAIVAFGRTVNVPNGDAAVELFRLPTKSIGFSAGNSINPNLDANSAGGSTGANVSDRDPSVSATVDQIQSGMDWESMRDNALAVRVVCVVGTTQGNIVGFVVPNGQVLEANTGNADGVVVNELNVRPRRVLEGGDDEVFFFQL
jgi:hypothetical protein